jgi:hypothetical protein
MKFLGRRTLARVTLAVPRTLRIMHTMAMGGDVTDGKPTPRLSVGLVAGVAMDEALLAMRGDVQGRRGSCMAQSS